MQDFAGMDSIDGNPTTRPVPAVKNWSTKQRQEWTYSEICLFLEEYVFLHKTQLTEFVNAVEDLRVLEKTGYPCRECGQMFKFHSIRVNHERTQHGQVNNGNVTVEQDEFGYFLCRYRCGKTYKTKQGRNRKG